MGILHHAVLAIIYYFAKASQWFMHGHGKALAYGYATEVMYAELETVV
jgi:hypothetical protein